APSTPKGEGADKGEDKGANTATTEAGPATPDNLKSADATKPPAPRPSLNTPVPDKVPEKPPTPRVSRGDAGLGPGKAAIAYLEGKRGSGTSFLVGKGILATNNHVLQDEFIDNLRARFISVEKPSAKALPVKLLYRNRARDLALLGVDSEEKPLALAS